MGVDVSEREREVEVYLIQSPGEILPRSLSTLITNVEHWDKKRKKEAQIPPTTTPQTV